MHFGNIHKRIRETLNILDSVQQSPATPLAHEQEISLKLDSKNLLIREESLWCSKSRETWLTCKDLNSKYFHTSILIRRRLNAVNFLKLDSGGWVSFRAEIGGNFLTHFTTLFTSLNPLIENEMLDLFSLIILEEENAFLCTHEEEISEVLASLGTTKALGPDGFTTIFYKKYWHVVRKDVLICIEQFFKNHNLVRNQSHAFLALVPKINGFHIAHQFRPISLCNIVYKIISKVLANRFKRFLPKIISPL